MKEEEYEKKDKDVAWYSDNRCVVRGYVCCRLVAYLPKILRKGKDL